jgi:uncharacterized membrane protein
MKRQLASELRRTFFTGLIVIAPLFATVWIVWGLYDYVQSVSPFKFAGGALLTILAVLLIILAVGWLSRTALGTVMDSAEEWLTRVPGVGLIYKALRDLVNAISGKERRFQHPVWVHPIPGSPLKLIGFITREDLGHLGVTDEVAVYLPDSYNISGKLVVLPREAVKPIESSSRDLFAFVATGGLTGAQQTPHELKD